MDPKNSYTLRLRGMSWGVKTTCFKAPGVSLGGSGVSIGGVRILSVVWKKTFLSTMGFWCTAIVQPPNFSEQNGCVSCLFFSEKSTQECDTTSPQTTDLSKLLLPQPGTQMTSIFEGQPPKTRPNFQSKQGAPIWVPGINKLNHFAYFSLGHLGIVRVSPLPRCIGCITTRIMIFLGYGIPN